MSEATENFSTYGVDPGSFRFVVGDVFDVLARNKVAVDVVLCLGFMYHTLRYNELWWHIRETGARYVVVDSLVYVDPSDEVTIRLASEPAERQGNAIVDQFSLGESVLVGRPTAAALDEMARASGFVLCSTTDWDSLLRDNPSADGVGDYRQGRRVTRLYERSTGR